MTDTTAPTGAIEAKTEIAAERSNRCDLCGNTRVSPGSEDSGFDWSSHPASVLHGRALECPLCRAVRLKHGSYWYPATTRAAAATGRSL